jgi:hypothetical protein
MKRMCAVLAVAGALAGVAPVSAVAAGTSSSSGAKCVVPLRGLMIPLC